MCFEVLVVVEDDRAVKLGHGGGEQINDAGSPMQALRAMRS
jgi:hypothetical protein